MTKGSNGTGHRSPAPILTNVLVVGLAVSLFFTVVNCMHLIANGRIPPIWYLGAERNLPTWWSSTQLLVAGLLLGVVAIRNVRISFKGRLLAVLALILVAMAMDEIVGLHERAGMIVDRVFGDRVDTLFHVTGLWFLVIGIPFVGLLAVLMWQMNSLLAEAPGTRVRIALAFAVLLFGAIGVEALTNFASLGAADGADRPVAYMAVNIVEETFEMVGGTLLVWASLRFLLMHWSTRGIAEFLVPLAPSGRSARLAKGAPRVVRQSGTSM